MMEKQKLVMFPVKEVTDVNLAFGGIDGLMPDYDEIPDLFKQHNGTIWNRVASKWFFTGIKGATFTPKEGVDIKKALRHLAAIQNSFSPRHEHKEAAVAYLMSLWFEDVQGI